MQKHAHKVWVERALLRTLRSSFSIRISRYPTNARGARVPPKALQQSLGGAGAPAHAYVGQFAHSRFAALRYPKNARGARVPPKKNATTKEASSWRFERLRT